MQNMNKEMRVVLYHNDENNISVNAIVQNDSIWIAQKTMAELFGTNTPAISKYLKTYMTMASLPKVQLFPKWK